MSFDDEFSWFLYFIGAIVNGLIWGAVSKAIIGGKGYDEATQGSYYWIGFFLGFIGLILALAKPQNTTPVNAVQGYNNTSLFSESPTNSSSAKAKTEDTWKCYFCGRSNSMMSSGCICGKTKVESKRKEREEKSRPLTNPNLPPNPNRISGSPAPITVNKSANPSGNNALDNIEIIKKYKELLDIGAITQEDYDKKKSELLG